MRGKKEINWKRMFKGKTDDEIEEIISHVKRVQKRYYLREKYIRHKDSLPTRAKSHRWRELFEGKSKEEIVLTILQSDLKENEKEYLRQRFVYPPKVKRKNYVKLLMGKTKEEIVAIIDKAEISGATKSRLRRKFLRDGRKMTFSEIRAMSQTSEHISRIKEGIMKGRKRRAEAKSKGKTKIAA